MIRRARGTGGCPGRAGGAWTSAWTPLPRAAAVVVSCAVWLGAAGAAVAQSDAAAHWAARSTLANVMMFSGLGEPLPLSMSRMDDLLAAAGYVARPAMPAVTLVGAVYAAGDPEFVDRPDFSDPATLRWNTDGFDRTLDPAAQAWALAKITGPMFHLNFHESKADRLAALMMLPQALEQARVLDQELTTGEGLFAAKAPDGSFAPAEPRDQAAVLWGVSNLILASTSGHDDYWHRAYRAEVDAEDYRELAARARAALEALPAETPADRALAVEALGRFALIAEADAARPAALDLAREHADTLAAAEFGGLEDLGLAVWGLSEAGRLFGEARYGDAAADLFRERLLPLWDEDLGVFRAGETVRYAPANAAAVVAALDAMRWFGPDDLASRAQARRPRLFDAVFGEGRLMLSSPLPLVPAEYREGRPDSDFTPPGLPEPAAAMLAPVFAGAVRHEAGAWQGPRTRFRTADALFLANMLVMANDGQADSVLPADRLSRLER